MKKKNHKVNENASGAIETYDFHGDQLEVVRGAGVAHVVIRKVCEALGIDYARQLQKLKDDASITVGMMSTVADDGKVREVACVEIRSLPLWLATIHPSKVKPAVRSKVVLYRKECADVLADHFLGKRGAMSTGPDGFSVASMPTVRQAVSAELVQVRDTSNAILTHVERLPTTVEGLGASLHPRLHQIVIDANAPLAARVAEGHNALIRFVEQQALVMSQIRGEIASIKDHIGIVATGIKITHEMVVAMDKRVLELKDYLASNTGSIGEHRAEVLRTEIDYIANAWVQLGWSKKPTLRSAKTDIMKDVLGGVHWTGSGQTLDGLPVVSYPHVRARLKALRTRADRALAAIKRKRGSGAAGGRLRQGELFADKPENKPN